jgi:protein-L-isoaspartate O-methyltransferase
MVYSDVVKLHIKTYKHNWRRVASGDWIIENRSFYWLGFLKFLGGRYEVFGKQKDLALNPELIYEQNNLNGQKFMNVSDDELQKSRVKKFLEDQILLNLIQNKRILDVSGGSGYFAAELIKYGAKSVVTTELSEHVVNFTKLNTGLKSFKYDINKDVLEKQVNQGAFDLILLRGCIEFSINLPELVHQLTSVLNDKGQVLITFIEPTLGCALRTQFDDYNVKVLRSSTNVEKCFISEKYTMDYKKELYLFNRDYAFEHLRNKLRFIYLYYLLKIIIKKGGKNLDNFFSLESKCELRIFSKNVDS